MLIGLLIKCLSAPIHMALRHPQLLFNLCPAIVHLFNWLEVRGSGKGSSPPYHSAAQRDANFSHHSVDLNDKWHDFHWKHSTKEGKEKKKNSTITLKIKTYSLKIKMNAVCHSCLFSIHSGRSVICLMTVHISFFRLVVTNKNGPGLRLLFNCIDFLARTLKPTGLNCPSSTDRPHTHTLIYLSD